MKGFKSGTASTITLLPEHAECSEVQRIAPPSLHPAHALLAAPQALDFPSAWKSTKSVGVLVHVGRRTPGREGEIKVDDTLLVVRWEE